MSKIDDIVFFYQESSPDEFREYYKKLDLTEDESKELDERINQLDDYYYLTQLEPWELYDEVTHRLESGEFVSDDIILKLLKNIKRPKEPITSQQAKIAVFQKLNPRLIFRKTKSKKQVILDWLEDLEPEGTYERTLKNDYLNQKEQESPGSSYYCEDIYIKIYKDIISNKINK